MKQPTACLLIVFAALSFVLAGCGMPCTTAFKEGYAAFESEKREFKHTRKRLQGYYHGTRYRRGVNVEVYTFKTPFHAATKDAGLQIMIPTTDISWKTPILASACDSYLADGEPADLWFWDYGEIPHVVPQDLSRRRIDIVKQQWRSHYMLRRLAPDRPALSSEYVRMSVPWVIRSRWKAAGYAFVGILAVPADIALNLLVFGAILMGA